MFKGFPDNETFTQIPDTFFQRLLNQIDDADELKVTLYILWRIEHMESKFRAVCVSEIIEDKNFTLGQNAARLNPALEKTIQRGSLLLVDSDAGGWYFINSPRGRASAEAMKKGNWRGAAVSSSNALRERPNVFKLYEENIGALTPLIADALKDAEETYSEAWVADAIEESTKHNKRNWKYIEAILRGWKENGRGKKQTTSDDPENRKRDVKRKIEKFLKG